MLWTRVTLGLPCKCRWARMAVSLWWLEEMLAMTLCSLLDAATASSIKKTPRQVMMQHPQAPEGTPLTSGSHSPPNFASDTLDD